MPLVRIRDVVPGRSGTWFDGDWDDRYQITNGEYLIGMDGEFNLGRWSGGTALLNQRVCRIGSVHSSVHLDYLVRWLPIALAKVEAETPFATVKHLSAQVLRAIEVPLPPLEEQMQIASILNLADSLRAKRRQVLAELEVLEASLNSGILDGGDWVGTLEALADVQIGPFGSLLHREDYIDGGLALINPTHIRNGRLRPDPSFSVDEKMADKLSKYRLRVGDVVMGRRGEMGRAGIVLPEHDGMICGTGSLILRPRSGVDSTVLHAIVTSPRMRAYLDRASLGVTLANLNTKIVKTAPAPLVDPQLAKILAAGIVEVDNQRAVVLRAIGTDQELFGSLQARAFGGDL
jgi:type I restriction enzyme S subunit